VETIAGVFSTVEGAERAVTQLRNAGFSEINLLLPGASAKQVDAVPTSDTEQSGMGKAVGGLVGAGIGIAGGLHLGTAAASALIPGVGPVIAVGMTAAALLGAGGFAAGAAAGEAVERKTTDGIPVDELWVYKDALRQGRSVAFVQVSEKDQIERVRNMLADSGAESIDAARHAWWIGLRDAEQEQYDARGGDFTRDERAYRRGFEAAQHGRGSVDEALASCAVGPSETDAFRRGYERGLAHRDRRR
jgi:hypothetical protein